MGEGQRAFYTIANLKRTGKPFRADDVQLKDVCLLAKLLLQQHRTCLHRRRKRRGEKRRLNCEN